MPVGGIDWVAVQAALQDWVTAGTGLAATKVVWGQQAAPRPEAPAVLMRISNLSESGTSWVWIDSDPQILEFDELTITAVDAGTDIFTCVAHGLLTGDGPVRIASTGTLPTLTAGGSLVATTDYWFIKITADTFKLAATYYDTGGGQGSSNPITPIDISSAGSGTITLAGTASTLRAGEELLALARGYLKVTLELTCHSAAPVGNDMAVALLQRVRTRSRLPSQTTILQTANIGLIDCDRVRALYGTRDAFLFEPRAFLDVHLSVPVEEGENLTIITRAFIDNLATGQTFTVTDDD